MRKGKQHQMRQQPTNHNNKYAKEDTRDSQQFFRILAVVTILLIVLMFVLFNR